MQTIGIDIGGTNIRIGLIDKENRLTCFKKFSQSETLKNGGAEKLSEFIRQYIKENACGQPVSAVCAAFPAAVDKSRSTVLNAPNIVGFNGVNVKKVLQDELNIPIYIEKDTNALISYDIWRYAIDPKSIAVGIYAGTGLGYAIYIEGNILTGANGVSGELGHIPVWDCNIRCSCGNSSCAETFVGGKYLVELQKTEFSQTAIDDIFKKHCGHPLVDTYIKRLASVIATEINIIDPEIVILGGGVISMSGFPEEKLIKYIREHARKPLPEKNLKFVISASGGENGVIGAGIIAWNGLRKENRICG